MKLWNGAPPLTSTFVTSRFREDGGLLVKSEIPLPSTEPKQQKSPSPNASHVGQGFRTIELRTVESGGAKGSIEKRSSTREIIQLRRRQDVDRLRNGSRHLPILRKPRRSRHRSARGKRRRFVRKTTKKRNRIDFPFRSPHDSDEDLSGDGLQRAAGT